MRWRVTMAVAGAAACAAACGLLWPHARDAAGLLAAQDDPVALSDLQLVRVVRQQPTAIADQIEAALAADDPDLANSFVALAEDLGVSLPAELTDRVAAAVAHQNSVGNTAQRFAAGFVTGQSEDAAGLSGAVAGDLLVFGDIRDVVRETSALARGEEADRVMLGLAAAGIAITAATYVSVGGTTPVRAGLSLVKDARKIGRLSAGLSRWAGRSMREMVDAPRLQQAVASSSLLRPAQAASGIKAAFRTEKAGALVRVAKDVGRIGSKAGTRGAFDVLKVADNPKEIARAARLVESKGAKSRAILKMLGRGALVLAAGAFELALWIFWALMALFGVVASIKASTERLTWAWLNARKARQRRHLLVSSPLTAA